MLRFLPFILFAFVFNVNLTAQKEAYSIKIKIDNYENDTLLLGHFVGNRKFAKDTAIGTNKQGYFIFTGNEPLKGGEYIALIKPSNLFFSFVIPNEKDQQLTITTKLEGNDLVSAMKIQGSDENKVFLDYIHFLSNQNKRASDLKASLSVTDSKISAETDPEKKKKLEEEKAKLQEEFGGLNEEVFAKQDEVISKHPDYLAAKMLAASREPRVPEKIRTQKMAAYLYYKGHYWDGFDWADDRLTRTAVFQNKIDDYFKRLTATHPDSSIISVEYIMNNVEQGGNAEMYEFAAKQLLNKFANNKTICMDKVYYHIGSKYYCGAKRPDWVDEKQLEKICNNVADLKYSLCGGAAYPIQLKNIQDSLQIPLYSLQAPYTIVYFWDPSCGTCSKTSEKLIPIYNKYKDKGLKIYGVCSENIKNVSACQKKVKDLGIEWLNTTDENRPLGIAKKAFNIIANPTIYLLDRDKKIMFKRLTPEQVDDILEREFSK